MVMAVTSGARVWTPFKDLHSTVQGAIHRHQQEASQDLESVLRKHKNDFISLLQNPAKNPVHRDHVMRADRDGVPIQGQQATQTLSREFIQEAIIISDLFDLNEFAAVELLMAGEAQQAYFPGLQRGLVAVLLYYDGHVSLVNSLRMLIQAREGRIWTLGLSSDVTQLVTRFTDQLVQEGLVSKILNLLKGLDVSTEMAKLQKEKALGPPSHRKQVADFVAGIRQSLAECIFCLACQCPLNKRDTMLLVTHLQQVEGSDAEGRLDSVTLALLMALLYCLDVRILEQDDAEDLMQKLPLVTDSTFMPDFNQEIISSHDWKNKGMKTVTQFVWAITLRALAQYPSIQGVSEFCEQDEVIVDIAIKEKVFLFLQHSVIAAPVLRKEEFYLRQLHNIIADFIVQMPLKVKELRNSGDEASRFVIAYQQEGIEPPANLSHDFEQLLEMIGAFYSEDPLGLELALEYWCPPEPVSAPGASGFTMTYSYRPPQRQISLYKFVRHAGDLLPPMLYIPYLRMLKGLATGPQCAHHTFNMLKGNFSGGQPSCVSWDHFFTSMNQYYANLRQEVPTSARDSHMHSFRHHHHLRGITPQEMEGLIAVLQLTRTVAEQDEGARLALCENPQWVPVMIFLGLISCSIIPKFKAEILLTLSAFAQTPEIASAIWQSLEVSQILPTLPSTSGVHQTGGIRIELQEVEAREEEYPMTRGFLHLLDALTDIPIPAGLGAGYRAPGFQPYLEFIRDTVFLPFHSRAYKDAAEKWEVCAAALQILFKLVNNHQVSLEDFSEVMMEVSGGGTVKANKPPGHALLIDLLNDSPTLKMVLFIIDEGTKWLDKYIDFPGKEYLEKSASLCLRLLHSTFGHQAAFLTCLRESGASVMVSQMDQLFLGINPRSGRPDHLVNVTKYVTYNTFLPEHALCAVELLRLVSQSPIAQPELVGLLTADKETSQNILRGFVQCLEDEDPEEQDDIPDEDMSSAQVCSETRKSILSLLLSTIELPTPNLAHFLLGFELRKPVKQTELQDPGVFGSARTCLHSILTLLNKGIGDEHGPASVNEIPQLARLAYRMIYVLCANRETSSPVMRYLRTAHDFLYRHLQGIPFQLKDFDMGSNRENLILSQQAWLLKSIAIELRLTSANRQRSHTQRLINLLLEDANTQMRSQQMEGGYDSEFIPYDVDLSIYGNQTQMSQAFSGGGQAQRKLISLLDAISFTQEYPTPLQLEFFEPAVVEQVIKSCEQRNDDGVMFCSVKMLHRILTNELNLQVSTLGGQRSVMMQEINSICQDVMARNMSRESVVVKREALEAWRQVVEVMLTACPVDIFPAETRQTVLFELLQNLFLKVSDEEVVPELTAPVSGVLLTLMSNLRHSFLSNQSELLSSQQAEYPLGMLDQSAGMSATLSTTAMGAMDQKPTSGNSRTLFSSSLQVVLKGLIEHIIRSSSGPQRVRANLYGALLYYLQIAQRPHAPDTGITREKGVGAMMLGQESEYERLTAQNMETISSYGEIFMEIVCRDACDGHDIGRMLAFSVLDSSLTFDKQQLWLSYMTSKGYIDHLVKSLLQDDEQLQGMLSQQPEPFKALYRYESKMSLLTRIAQTATGAQTLLTCGLMARLSECAIFDMKPDTDRPEEMSSFIPSVMQRYRQLLFPVLKLCLAVLTSLGSENKTATHQVLQFIVSHSDVFMMILRDRNSTLFLPALQELALTTDVIGRAAIDDGEDSLTLGDVAGLEFRGHVARIQRQMIALLPRYCFSERLQLQIKNLLAEGGSSEESNLQANIQLTVEQVAANVTSFCRALVSKSATNAQYSRLLFNPSLIEANSRDLSGGDSFQAVSMAAMQPPNLGIIVFMLRQVTTLFLTAFDTHKQLLRKLDSIPSLTTDELKELCGVTGQEKIVSQKRHQLAQQVLISEISNKTQQLRHLAYIIENCLFILWRHLDYFLVHCIPSESGMSLMKLHTKKQQQMRRLQDMSTGQFSQESYMDESQNETDISQSSISREELEQLKIDAVATINESLFKKLQEIDQCYVQSNSRYGFMGAVIRRLKRLLKLHTARN